MNKFTFTEAEGMGLLASAGPRRKAQCFREEKKKELFLTIVCVILSPAHLKNNIFWLDFFFIYYFTMVVIYDIALH